MSSTGTRLPLHEASRIADDFIARYCDGSGTVAGSIRRQKPEVGDVELLVPMPSMGDPMFDALEPYVESTGGAGLFLGSALYRAIKGFKPRFKYAQLESLGKGYKIDIFRYWPDQFGILLLIRTGPEGPWRVDWLNRLAQRGYRVQDGYITETDGGRRVDTPDEAAVFRALGWKFIAPERRGIERPTESKP